VNTMLQIGRAVWSGGRHCATARAGRWIAGVILCVTMVTGCGDVNGALERLSEARRLSVDLQLDFTRAADAANRAVMADTDELSVTFAGEAGQAKQAVHRHLDALAPILRALNYSDETRHLEAFATQFAAYEALDRDILDLAVENTNLKAQQLSFGPALEAANAFRDSIKALGPAPSAKDRWRVEALVETAVAAVREIQALQAPHIAEANADVMTRLERRMATSEAEARSVLESLVPLVEPASRPRLAAATVALDRFMDLNARIVVLSRRNTNVRSLALSLDQKRALTTTCEESLHALREALAKHGSIGSRSKY
jgi:hypothetical protein